MIRRLMETPNARGIIIFASEDDIRCDILPTSPPCTLPLLLSLPGAPEISQGWSGWWSSKSSQGNTQEYMSIFIIHSEGDLWADLSAENEHQGRNPGGRGSRRICKRRETLLPNSVKWVTVHRTRGKAWARAWLDSDHLRSPGQGS